MKNLKVAVFIFLVLFVVGCSVAPKGRKPSKDWSRGQPIGQQVSGSIGMAVEGDGQRVHLAWPVDDGQQVRIEYVQLNNLGDVVVDKELDLPNGRLRAPQLYLRPDGNLHFIWGARPSGQNWSLWYSTLSPTGEILAQQQLSAPEERVGSYVTYNDPSGGVYVAWEDDQTGAIVGQYISSEGRINQEASPITDSGTSPSLTTDSSGLGHVTWFDNQQIQYATITNDLTTQSALLITRLGLSTSVTLAGPVVGVSDSYAYIFWSVFNLTGLESGTGYTEYVAFPIEPGERVANLGGVDSFSDRVLIPAIEDIVYQPYAGTYAFTEIGSPGKPGVSSNYVFEPNSASGAGGELAVALSVKQQLRLQTVEQVNIALFEDGTLKGYQPATKTEALSQGSRLVVDDAGQLHLAWREGGQSRFVYYATTAPLARANLDSLSRDEVGDFLGTAVIEGITGVLFFPFAFFWLVPGLIVMGIRRFMKDDAHMGEPATILFFIVAVALYQLTKLMFLPTIRNYVPFSAWIDIPNNWQPFLLLGIPVVIFLIAGTVGYLIHRKTESALITLFGLTAVDALLTLFFYGVNILGAY
jgi:hypothetical protein